MFTTSPDNLCWHATGANAEAVACEKELDRNLLLRRKESDGEGDNDSDVERIRQMVACLKHNEVKL